MKPEGSYDVQSSHPIFQSQRGNLPRPQNPQAGKLRAAGNRCTLGFYSRRVVLKNESREAFDDLLHDYIDALHPQNAPELIAVNLMAAARWGALRLYALETRMLDEAERAVGPAILDPDARRSAAWFNLQHPGFYKLTRLRARYHMQLLRALKMLELTRQLGNTASNPLNTIFISAESPNKSTTCSAKKSLTPRRDPAANKPFVATNPPNSASFRPEKKPFIFSHHPNVSRPVTYPGNTPPHPFRGADTRVCSVETRLDAFRHGRGLWRERRPLLISERACH